MDSVYMFESAQWIGAIGEIILAELNVNGMERFIVPSAFYLCALVTARTIQIFATAAWLSMVQLPSLAFALLIVGMLSISMKASNMRKYHKSATATFVFGVLIGFASIVIESILHGEMSRAFVSASSHICRTIFELATCLRLGLCGLVLFVVVAYSQRAKTMCSIGLIASRRCFGQRSRKRECSCMFDDPCPICFDKTTKNSCIISLPCKHIYHVKCIERWFQHGGGCPLCRLPFNLLYKYDGAKKGWNLELQL